jgi:hypothetical protein
MSDAVDIMPSRSGFKTGVRAGFQTSTRAGFTALLVSVACLSASFATNALAGGARADGGFRQVSEELRGNPRAQGDTAPRINSIRTDVSRYNAERSTRSPVNPAEPNRQVQELRNGYRTN